MSVERTVSSEALAVANQQSADLGSLYDKDVFIIDTGAGELVSPYMGDFVPSSLVNPCGQRVVAAGNEKHTVTKLGRLRVRCVATGHIIDSKNQLAWYVPTMKFRLGGMGRLRGLGYGLSIGLDSSDFLCHVCSGEKIPVLAYNQVSVLRVEQTTTDKSLATYLTGRFAEQSALGNALAADWQWNTMVMQEEALHERAVDSAEHAAWVIPHGISACQDGAAAAATESTQFVGIITNALHTVPMTLQELHKRMGHHDARALKAGVDNGALKGISLTTKFIREECPDCRANKPKHAHFGAKVPTLQEINMQMQKSLQSQGSLSQLPVPVPVSTAPVERLLGRLVHLDGVGPTKSDRWGNVGFYTFSDQDTGAVFVRLYKRPSEVYGIVRDVNNHFISKYGGTGIQRVHTDQHPCFMQTTSAWRDVQNHCGFHTEYSSVYTPAQNSHAERANRRLLDCARTIMNAAGLEHWSWGLAILYASQVLNHVPLRRLDGKTATEALTGCAPQVHRFRIFGCTAWALIHKAHRATKFSPRAKQGIFMGFSTKAPAYLVWVPGTRELVESPHVMFDETKFGGASPVAVDTFESVQDTWKSDRRTAIPLGDDYYGRGNHSEDPVRVLKRGKRQQKRAPAPASRRGTEHDATPPLQDEDRALIMADAINAQRQPEPDPCIVHGDHREYAKGTPSEHGQNVVAAHKHWYYEQIDDAEDDSAYNYRNGNFDSSGCSTEAPDAAPDAGPTGKRARQQPRRFVPGTRNVPGLFLDSSTGIEYHDPSGPRMESGALALLVMARHGDGFRKCASHATKCRFKAVLAHVAAAVSMIQDVGPVRLQPDDFEACETKFTGAFVVKAATWDVPTSFWKALKRDDGAVWQEAWDTERKNMVDLKVLYQTDWPTDGSNVCGSKLVMKIKRDQDGKIDKYKVRWVAQGFSQQFGVDYFDTTSPVVSSASLRILIAVLTEAGVPAYTADAPAAFLRADLEEKVYMKPPRGVELPDVNGKKQCYRCLRSIYGLRQSSRNWWRKCTKEVFTDHGWVACPLDSCLFMKRQTSTDGAAGFDLFGNGTLWAVAALFVDDILFGGTWTIEVDAMKARLRDLYGCNKFDLLAWFLGWKFDRNLQEGWTSITQEQFVIDALVRFNLQDAHATALPVATEYVFEELDDSCLLNAAQQTLFMEKVGTLNYLATQTRADIAWVTSKLGMYMQQADMHAMAAADQVFTYLKGTADQGLTFWRGAGFLPEAWSDASFADSGKTGVNGRRRSQSGCIVKLGGAAVVFHSRGQKNVALSTAESEYVALSGCVQEVIWVRRVLHWMGVSVTAPTVVYEDNDAARILAQSEVMTKRSRFVETRFHYTREMVLEGEVTVVRCDTKEMTADLQTKGLARLLLTKHWNAARGFRRPTTSTSTTL